MFCLFAPNVHTGGGFVLLNSMLAAWPESLPCIALLDRRAERVLMIPPQVEAVWCDRSLISRLKAEYFARRRMRKGDTVFCFHNLPPLFRSRAKVYCYIHNRYVLGTVSLSDAVLWVKFRVFLERSIARLFQVNVDRYIVQTPTMKRDLIAWMRRRPRKRGDAPIDIMPFVDLTNVEIATNGSKLCWDFIYVADGSGHKNHRRLFEAFRLLAEEGHRPTLAITVSEDDFALLSALDELRSKFHLNIVNLGQLPHREVLARYRQARAVIFPSYAESFGIPLIEATKAGTPIIASELDFVRDVCVPVETFDPLSEVSIARAIKRFLFGTADPIELQSSKQFVRSLVKMSAIES